MKAGSTPAAGHSSGSSPTQPTAPAAAPAAEEQPAAFSNDLLYELD